MKFGKLLLKASESCTSFCNQQDWMQYKILKKELKRLYIHNNQNNNNTKPTHTRITGHKVPRDDRELVQSESGKVFFTHLKSELLRVSIKYVQLEQSVLTRYNAFCTALEDTKATKVVNGSASFLQSRVVLIKQCISIHESLLMLSNYAVLNYCGFTKILKKHDKLSGFCTRDKFLCKIVSGAPFASTKTWRNDAIAQVENLFKSLHKQVEDGKDALRQRHHEAVGLGMGSAVSRVFSPALVNPGSPSTESAVDEIPNFGSFHLVNDGKPDAENVSTLHKEGLDILASLATKFSGGPNPGRPTTCATPPQPALKRQRVRYHPTT